MGQSVTRSELAKLWNVTRGRVDNMVQAGQLPVKGNGKIDLEIATAIRQSMAPDRLEQGDNARRSKQAERPELNVIEGGKDGGDDKQPTIYRARTAKAVHDARMAEINVKKALGAVVDRDAVKAEAHAAARVLVQRLLAIPARVAPIVAVELDDRKCRVVIEQEIRQVIVEFQELLAAL
jgi:hypothetical protein